MPHRISRPFGVPALIWSWVRGIHNHKNWRRPCARCGFTGQAHYNIIGPFTCPRFKPIPGPLRRE